MAIIHPARPTNHATRFGPPFSVFSVSGLSFRGKHLKGLFVVLGHQKTSLSDLALVRFGCRSEGRYLISAPTADLGRVDLIFVLFEYPTSKLVTGRPGG